VARKRQVVHAAVERVRETGPVTRPAALASVAGFEIAAMAGFFAEASRQGLTVVLDGYVCTAAALVAKTLAPECVDSMIAAHRSAEPGHAAALAELDLVPMLDWQLRLGEGTGALLLLPMLAAAAAICSQMSSFRDLGVALESNP
jgi:nicotinate-nucleotide--dimethylbenzimidazole phosphoribosyltransferase